MKRVYLLNIVVLILFCLQGHAQKKVIVSNLNIVDTVLKDSPYYVTSTLSDWKISFIGGIYDEAYTLTARITKVDADTIKNLVLIFNKDMVSSGIAEYSKEFSMNENRHHLLFDKKDTLYHYYSPLNNENSPKTFIVGEYYFKSFTHEAMTFEERAFFRKHRDSLIKIKGNNLPKLPSN